MLDGWVCDHCRLFTLSWKWLRVHYNKGYSIQGKVPKKPTVKIQILFTGLKRVICYFCVIASGAAANGDIGAYKGAERRFKTEREGIAEYHRLKRGGQDDLECLDKIITKIKEQWVHDQG